MISDWYRLGLVLLASAVVLGIYAAAAAAPARLGPRPSSRWLVGGGAVVVSLAFPGASYLLTWSLVGGALGLGAAALVDRPRAAAGRRRRSSPSPAPCPASCC